MSDAAPDPLEPMAAQGVHVHDDGTPPPVSTPHRVLLEAIETQRVTLTALVRWLDAEGLLPRATLDDLRHEVRAEEAVDASVGLLADLTAAGQIAPWPAGALARAEARFPCGCSHRPSETPVAVPMPGEESP